MKNNETYQICVTVIEAKYLEPNTNPMVVVRVGNRKKKTIIRKSTDNPYYNEYFVFDLTCNMDALLSTSIEIAVYLCGRLGRTKFHGNIVFEVATVWDQPNHQYHHKWAMLTNREELGAGPKGYVKCNIAVHVKGQKFKMPPEIKADDDIEGNLLLPLGNWKYFSTRQHARFMFSIYRAEDFPSSGSKQYSVTISFAGMKATTKAIGNDGDPRFNELIIFRDMFPPLTHRAKIILKHGKQVFASQILNFKSISNSGSTDGFLPTFGPSFLHLYKNNNGGDAQPIYRGRILFSLRTEIEQNDSIGGSSVKVEPTASIVETSLWNTEEYLLVGVLYDICMIDRSLLPRGKSISFEISIGNAGNQRFSAHQNVCTREANQKISTDELSAPPTGCGSPDSQSESMPFKITSSDGYYNYVPLEEKKPCLFVRSWWPNNDWRSRNCNRLTFIAEYLECELRRIEMLAAIEHNSAYTAYNTMSRCLKQYLINYLHSLQKMASGCSKGTDEDVVTCMTNLDKHRLNHCKTEMEKILEKISTNGELVDNRIIKIALFHAHKNLRVIKKLCEDPQHSLPDIFLWMLSGSRRLAYARLAASRIIYAEEHLERGHYCGRRLELFLECPDKSGSVACKVELVLWLGGAKFAPDCWSALPPGYVLEQNSAARLDVFPRYLEYRDSSKFQLKAHIFQGRFEIGMDSTSLLDPVLQVTFQGHTMRTKVIKQSLDPFWDQTLIFPVMNVYGSPQHIKFYPPKVVIEAFDVDFGDKLEFCGRCIDSPVVKLSKEAYKPPHFPPRLSWCRLEMQNKHVGVDFGGAVLTALELIEIDAGIKDDQIQLPEEMHGNGILRVLKEIRPKMASYRMELIFWGVRDLRRVNLLPVMKPKIVVECAGVRIESEIMENAKKFSNFKQIHSSIDLEIAEEEIYHPPITIKAYDARGFGYFKYVGVYNSPSIHIFLAPLITKTEYDKAIYHPVSESHSTTEHAVPIEYERLKSTLEDLNTQDEDENEENGEQAALISYKKLVGRKSRSNLGQVVKRMLKWRRSGQDEQKSGTKQLANFTLDKDESHDWWSKYYASLQVYNAELESQPEFAGFQDRLRTFELRRGKKVGDSEYEANNCVGKFKGFISIYRWPHPEGLACVSRSGKSASFGYCSDYPSQEPLVLLVRLYVIRAINLRPSDPLSGKADPYLRVELGGNVVNDRKNYVPNQLNPIFGRRIEVSDGLML
ncbi:hypothetical protein QAD02_019750 [Eretmocerus hayati]|uniref:Uncharacterized protein n=1 Tax=Eretmocerus hayati TaxID=131215 RepID=A0ACC2PLK0_9HYME|nr:hypothetical protein QAD02_019750 [Eretmocerus hayati]